MLIHVLRHRIVPGHEVEFVSFLRHVGLNAAIEAPGIVAVYVGRRLAHQRKEHVAVTVWGGAEPAELAIDESGVPRFLRPVARLLDEVDARAYDCEGADIERGATGKIVRVARWVGDRTSEASPLIVPRRPAGCVSVCVGTSTAFGAAPSVPGERLAVSVWRGWEALTAATAGRLGNALPVIGELPAERASIRQYEMVREAYSE